jgi:threonine/homoserine/homoserine lactone efflux protein
VGALLVFYIFYIVGLSHIVIQIISLCGALILFWLGSKVLKIKEINTESKQLITFPKVVVLTAFNSGYWLFWITIGVPKALYLSTIILALIFYKFRPFLQKKNLVGVTFKILGIVLILLGVKTLLNIF